MEGCEQLVTYYTSRLPLGPLLFLLLLLFYVYLHKIPHFIKGVLCVFQKHCFFFPILFDQALLAGDKMCMCNQFKGSFHQNESETFRLDHTGRRSHMVAKELHSFSWNIETSTPAHCGAENRIISKQTSIRMSHFQLAAATP